MFSIVKAQVLKAFNDMTTSGILFTVNVDKELLWETYLLGFTDEERQGHNCNCCKQFIKNYGTVVAIVNNELKTVWDFVPDDLEYVKSIVSLGNLVRNSTVGNVFLTESTKMGTDSNYDVDNDCTWTHFSVIGPKWCVKPSKDLDTLRSTYRTSKEVFKRGLDELSVESLNTVLELISQDSLYKGKEFKSSLELFLSCKQEYLAAVNKDHYTWRRTMEVSGSISGMRNTAIGTLLVDLSNGIGLDDAVNSFERKVAPTNYKRPSALITKGMIEEAEKAIESLGLSEALGRRFATYEDINVNNVLFVDRDAKKALNIMDELKEDIQINPKSFSKVEEIHIDKFISDVLPNSKSIEILVENSHLNNLVSLIAPKEPTAPGLFKWSNPFSWAYVNSLTDSMKERVKSAGGKVDGVLRFTIQWNEDGKSVVDFDAHAYEPDGTHIYYCTFRGLKTKMSGTLDVDMINPTSIGVENITWSDIDKMKEGIYKFSIVNFNNGRNNGFSAEIEFNGEIHSFSRTGLTTGHTEIATVTYSKKTGFTIKPIMESSSTVTSKEKWGISTNKFRKVSVIMESPNYWTDKVGNRHVFFVLDGAKNVDATRGFFNEFLKEDLDKNRKVFEVLGSKLTVEPSDKQLTGVGFSDTQRNSIICKVEGSFTRTLKVTF